MATSNWQNISLCCEIIFRVRPNSVLDVGLNSAARWGALVRDFADVWHGRMRPEDWTVQLHAIEAFEKNIHPVHRLFYNEIYTGDAFEVIDTLNPYDLIILGDVIEHFEKDRALAFLQKCISKAKYVLINTPGGSLEEWAQGEEYGNPWEKHLCILNKKDLKKHPAWKLIHAKKYRDLANRPYWTYVITSKGNKDHFKL